MNDLNSDTTIKKFGYAWSDSWQVTVRNIRRNFRLPQLLFFSSAQPVMFLLLFNYVFGGAVSGGGSYINFLLPGILIQTVLFGAIQTGVGLAEDIQKGVTDRFRSLPMSRVSHMAGRILADAIRNVFVLALMFGVGMLLGFRIDNSILLLFVGLVLSVFFGIAFSWVASLFGIITKDAETAQVFGFLWTFPLVFASSVFVPVQTMPGWLQSFANNQPITHAVNSMRYLTLGVGNVDAIWKTVIWIVGLIIVVAPIAVYKYRRVS